MCIINNRKLTEEEKQTLTEGYKLFHKTAYDSMLKTPWQDCLCKIGVWLKAKPEVYSWVAPKKKDWSKAGFYVFISKVDAEAVVKARHEESWTHIRKVQIRKLIDIGDASGFDGDDVVSKQGVVRCKEIRILKETN